MLNFIKQYWISLSLVSAGIVLLAVIGAFQPAQDTVTQIVHDLVVRDHVVAVLVTPEATAPDGSTLTPAPHTGIASYEPTSRPGETGAPLRSLTATGQPPASSQAVTRAPAGHPTPTPTATPKRPTLTSQKTPYWTLPPVVPPPTPAPTAVPIPVPVPVVTPAPLPLPIPLPTLPISLPTDIIPLVESFFPEDPETAVYIATRESVNFRDDVVYGPTVSPTDDRGVMQINAIHADMFSAHGWNYCIDAFDPVKNLTIARELYDTSGWRPWSTY